MLAMRDFEGKPGDPNYRNNNPLNFRCSPVGYLPMYEPVICTKDHFAHFKDWATGWLYAQNSLKATIHNHPNWTLFNLISHHAPKEDGNDPVHYATVVGKKIGVDITFLVKYLV